jgi:NADPH2:quinone reductase
MVSIQVRAAGMNPADLKQLAAPSSQHSLPLSLGYEVAGVISGMGPNARLASGGGEVGDEVIAFRVSGGYASELIVPDVDVFAKPQNLSFPEAANLLLAGSTAAEMLHRARVRSGETILLHGASGAVGVSVLQQAREIGAHVIGSASRSRFDVVKRFGGTPIEYGEGLLERTRAAAPDGVSAALDTGGTDEAIRVSLSMAHDRDRVVSIVAAAEAQAERFTYISSRLPASSAYRDEVRSRLIALAALGKLEVPMARTFPFSRAPEALSLLSRGHPGGKIALIPD